MTEHDQDAPDDQTPPPEPPDAASPPEGDQPPSPPEQPAASERLTAPDQPAPPAEPVAPDQPADADAAPEQPPAPEQPAPPARPPVTRWVGDPGAAHYEMIEGDILPQRPRPPAAPEQPASPQPPNGPAPPQPPVPPGAPGPSQPPVPPSAAHPSEPEPAGPEPAEREPAEREPAEPETPKKEKKKGSFLRELPILILIAFALAMLIKTFFIQAFYIPSESMVPTLEVDDRVLVNKIVYRIRDPRRGEIVVFVGEREEEDRSFLQRVRDAITEGLGAPAGVEKDFIKRVIALPGETIEVTEEGTVLITPVSGPRFKLEEPYLAAHDPAEDSTFGPYTVPEDSYFVMGDNRDNSSDSRSTLGPIRRSDIIGKAFVRIWPVGRFSFFRTPSYGEASAVGLLLLPVAVPAMAGATARVRRRR